MANKTEHLILVHMNGDAVLHPKEIWPDGNIPTTITMKEIIAAMEKESKADFFERTVLLEAIEVQVSCRNPHYTQEDSLLPDLAPEPFHTDTVWAVS
jgi:hypothetical protein